MSPDSISQLAQARTRRFGDWHPPLMTWTWSLLNAVIPGPLGMLLFHNLMFWAGLALVIYLTPVATFLAPLLIITIGFFPPVVALLSTIWKDVGMGASMLLASSLMLYADRRSSRPALLLAICCLLYGFSVRYNAAPAVLPLALWSGFIGYRLFDLKTHRPLFVSSCLGTGIFVVIASSGVLINSQLTTVRMYPIQQLLLYDLAAISVKTQTLQFPDYLISGSLTIADLERLYTPARARTLYYGDDPAKLDLTSSQHDLDRLTRQWLHAVPRFFGTYLQHRLNVFATQLGATTESVCVPYWDGIEWNRFGIEFEGSQLNNLVMDKYLAPTADSILFRGWFYLVVSAGVALWCFNRCRTYGLGLFAISLSGLFYLASFVIAGNACDFRLNWWTVITTLVVTVVCFATELSHRFQTQQPLDQSFGEPGVRPRRSRG
jgi:hypothetical protein